MPVTCPSCGKVTRSEHGLVIHEARWCTKKQMADEVLLQQYQEYLVEHETDDRLRQEEAARHEREMQEEEALHAQR